MAVAAAEYEAVTIHHSTGAKKSARGDAMETFTDRATFAKVVALTACLLYTSDAADE